MHLYSTENKIVLNNEKVLKNSESCPELNLCPMGSPPWATSSMSDVSPPVPLLPPHSPPAPAPLPLFTLTQTRIAASQRTRRLVSAAMRGLLCPDQAIPPVARTSSRKRPSLGAGALAQALDQRPTSRPKRPEGYPSGLGPARLGYKG